MSVQTPTGAADVVRSGYEAFGRGDMETLAQVFAPDAVWTHHNAGRFEGPKHGFDAIAAFFGESMTLTAGTLRAIPEELIGAGDDVAVISRVSGTRPDGRELDDVQVHLFRVRGGRTVSVDQYVGDPAAVEAFWS